MVAFNPDVQPASDPNYLGWAKSVDTPHSDTSGAYALEGIGKAIEDPLKVADFYFKHDAIDKTQARGQARVDEMTSAVEALHAGVLNPKTNSGGGGGDDQDSLLGSGGGGAIPEPVKNLKNNMRQYIAFRAKAGGVGAVETMYKGLVAKDLKDLRSEYPMYRKEIDATMQHVTGVAGANAYLSDMLRDINAAMATKDEERTKLLSKGMDKEVMEAMGKDWYSLYQGVVNNQPGAKEKFATAMQASLRDRYDLDMKLKSLHVDEAQGKVTTEQTYRTSLPTFYRYGTTALKNVLGGMDLNNADKWTNLELSNASTKIKMDIQQTEAELRNRLNTWKAPNGQTLSVAMGGENVEKVIAHALQGHKDVLGLITDKNPTLATSVARTQDAMVADNTKRLTGTDLGAALIVEKTLQGMGASPRTQEILNPTLHGMTNMQYLRDVEAAKKVFYAHRELPASSPVSTKATGIPFTFDKLFDHVKDVIPLKHPDRPHAFENLVQMAEAIGKPETPEAAKDILIPAMFHPANAKFIEQFERDGVGPGGVKGKYSIMDRLTSPDMIKAYKESRYWPDIQDWFKSTYTEHLLRDEIGVLRGVVNSGDLKVEWRTPENNNGKYELRLEPRPQDAARATTPLTLGTPSRVGYEDARRARVSESLALLSRGLNSYAKIGVAGGDDVPGFLLRALHEQGVDPQRFSGVPEDITRAIIAAHKSKAMEELKKKYEKKE